MRVRRALGLAGAVLAGAFAACKDIPFAPYWDADMYLPMSTKAIYLNQRFSLGSILPNTSDTVSFSPQRQDVSGAVKDVLKNLVTDPARARTILTLTVGKRTAVSVNDTLFVAPDSASLISPNPGRVVLPVALAVTDTSVMRADTVSLASIQMMQSAATSQSPLWIQLRGRVSNSNASPVTITPADSLAVKLTVTARIAVSHK